MPASPCRIPSLPLAVLCLALLPALSAAQAQRQEYSLRQEADEGLLVRVNGYEADFRSALSEYGDEAALFAEVPGERLAPLFHYLSPPTRGRELVLVVETLAGTARTRYQVEPVRITVRDERSAQLAAAYRALAQGVDAEGGAGAAAWTVRIYGLDQAAGTFAGLGMQDLYSWSAFYAAWFVLHRLGDSHSALDRAEQLLESLRGVRRQAVRLATLRLRADILAAQRLAGELPGQPDDPLQQAWEEVAALAADEDQQLELAAARFAQGRDLATREQPQLALERYREAQAIADRIGATALGTQVRESMVGVLGQQGDLGATGEVLAEIGDALAQRGDADPLALNLLEQGLLAIRTHRPGRAVAPLEEALSLSVNSLTRSQLQLALAQARFATGRLDDARALAREAVMVPGSGDIRRPIPALEVNAGLDLLAAVHRLRGEREALGELRSAQARWLGAQAQRAEFLWQRALDAWGSPAAGARFAAAAQAPGDAGLRSLAAAWACALGAASGGCGALPAPASFGAPWQQMEAQFASATQLARGGQPAGAGRALRTLVGQALYLRERMPGVLDVWIMERAPALADSLLGPLLAGDDATGALSALALLRRLETAPGPAGANEADDAFRAALAECEAAGSTCTGAEFIRTRMASGYAAFRGERPWLAGDGLGAWLGGLAPGQVGSPGTELEFAL